VLLCACPLLNRQDVRLFLKTAISVSDNVESRVSVTANNKLEIIYKRTVVA
jgi:hypothetical protein